MFNPEFLATENNDPNDENDLIQYLQKQSPEVLQRVAKSASEDIQEIIRHNAVSYTHLTLPTISCV